jgi:hypothetical protein
MPMDVRSWYIIRMKKLATKGQSWLTRHANIVTIVIFVAFALAYAVGLTDTLGKLAKDVAVETAKVGVETYWLQVKQMIKAVNITIEGQTTTTTTTIPPLPPP